MRRRGGCAVSRTRSSVARWQDQRQWSPDCGERRLGSGAMESETAEISIDSLPADVGGGRGDFGADLDARDRGGTVDGDVRTISMMGMESGSS